MKKTEAPLSKEPARPLPAPTTLTIFLPLSPRPVMKLLIMTLKGKTGKKTSIWTLSIQEVGKKTSFPACNTSRQARQRKGRLWAARGRSELFLGSTRFISEALG